jgi:hypothetical protein
VLEELAAFLVESAVLVEELELFVELLLESRFGVAGDMLLSRSRVPVLLAVRFEPLGFVVDELRLVLPVVGLALSVPYVRSLLAELVPEGVVVP